MRTIKTYIKGMIEFRSDFTTACDDLLELEIYDRGRDMMHKLTFRKFDH